MKRSIVLLKNIKIDYETLVIVDGDKLDRHYTEDSDYVQISEIINIDLPMLDVDINAAKIEAIDKDIQKAKAGIEMLEQAKAELLAIPDMSEERG